MKVNCSVGGILFVFYLDSQKLWTENDGAFSALQKMRKC
jgi:hypothetical protein